MAGTDGRRIYAIGDVHGCLDKLIDLMAVVDADLARHPHAAPLILFLGDFTDRGPDSRGVIETLIGIADGPVETIFLRGNHDQMFLTYLQDPAALATKRYHWLDGPLGGLSTLRSYGVTTASADDPPASAQAFRAAVPDAHVSFLENTTLWARFGDYGFVHAGIRPGLPLEEQQVEDLIWIRDPFLLEPYPHDEIIVHGHTPVNEIEHHGNRIAVDTGAVFGGRLSCLVLEEDQAFDLRPSGRLPCPPGTGLS